MLYKIKDDYYVRVGNKYVGVNFEIVNNDINLTPNHNKIVEKSPDLVVVEQPFNDKFKENYIKSKKKSSSDETRNDTFNSFGSKLRKK